MHPVAAQIISLLGAAAVLLGYFKVTSQRWHPRGSPFLFTNLFGSSLLLWIAVIDIRWGFIVLNGAFVWICCWFIFHPGDNDV